MVLINLIHTFQYIARKFMHQMDYECKVRVILASPNDVRPERKLVARVIERLNGMLADRNIVLRLYQWETSAYPGFHRKGRQFKIDEALEIEKSDLFIGILWKRFGTPVHDAESGTEHEFNLAYESYLKTDRPHIMFYFKEVSISDLSAEELEQYRKVKRFQDKFPEEGLWWTFKSKRIFEDQLLQHLNDFVQDHYPLPSQLISTAETLQSNDSVAASTTSKSIERKEASRALVPPASQALFSPYFRIPENWRVGLGLTILFFFILFLGIFLSLNSNLTGEHKYLAVIEKEVDPHLPIIVLTPLLPLLRSQNFDTDLSALPPSLNRIHLQLELPESEAAEFYDVSLIDERSDITLRKLTSMRARDKRISFTLNQKLLPEGRYRLILSRDTQVTEFYLFIIDR